jgi:hypothetical protein
MKQWEIDGLRQQTAFLDKVEAKLSSGKPLTVFERSLYKVETGLVDWSDADAGEERVIRYQE